MDTYITLRDIVQWEQLRDKSFTDFHGEDHTDLFTLMYVHDHQLKRKSSCESYCTVLEGEVAANRIPKELRQMLGILRHEFRYVEQFAIKHDTPADEADESDEKPRLTPIINAIIFQGGVDAKWVYEQGLDMLPILAQGLAEKQQRDMEDARFWNLLQVSPHIRKQDNDKLRRSLKFPWEKAKAGLDKITKKDISLAHAIFGSKK